MAKARLISCSLSTSRKFAELARAGGKLGEFAQVLYPLIVVHSDDFGRSSGDVFTVKHAVFPTSPRSLAAFGQALEAMVRVGLLERWDVAGQAVLAVVDFDRHQAGLHKRTRSRFPDPLGDSGKVPEIPSELNRTEQKRNEGKRTEERPFPPDGELDAAFAELWALYPKHSAKQDAVKAWRKLRPDGALQARIREAVTAQVQSADWTKDAGAFVPHLATFLRGRRWEDETPAPAARTSGHPSAAPGADAYRLADGWCEHDPRCASREVHALMLAREAEHEAIGA